MKTLITRVYCVYLLPNLFVHIVPLLSSFLLTYLCFLYQGSLNAQVLSLNYFVNI